MNTCIKAPVDYKKFTKITICSRSSNTFPFEAGIVLSVSLCVCLSVQNLENYWSEIDVAWWIMSRGERQKCLKLGDIWPWPLTLLERRSRIFFNHFFLSGLTEQLRFRSRLSRATVTGLENPYVFFYKKCFRFSIFKVDVFRHRKKWSQWRHILHFDPLTTVPIKLMCPEEHKADLGILKMYLHTENEAVSLNWKKTKVKGQRSRSKCQNPRITSSIIVFNSEQVVLKLFVRVQSKNNIRAVGPTIKI